MWIEIAYKNITVASLTHKVTLNSSSLAMAISLFSTSGSATIHIISPTFKSNLCRVFLVETASLFIGSVIVFYSFVFH